MNLRILLLALLLPLNQYGQNTNLDSLLQIFHSVDKADSVRYKAAVDAFMDQFRVDLDTARITGVELLKFTQSVGNKQWEARANRLIGNTYAVQAEYDKALEYFYASHQILLELGNEEDLAVTFNNLGTVYYELANYTQAQDFLLESLKLSEKLGDEITLSRALNNLGNLHNDLRNNEKALDYYKRSLDIRIKFNQPNRLPAAYNNIGLIYTNMQDYPKSIEYLEKSSEIAQEIGDIRSHSRALANIGNAYAGMGNRQKAQEYYDKAIEEKIRINDTDGLAAAYSFRGLNYLELNQFDKAKKDCQKSLAMAAESGALNLEKESCLCLSRAYEGTGSYVKSLDFIKQYQVLKDSLFNKEKTQEITRAEMNYAFDKKLLSDSIAYQKKQASIDLAHERELNKEHRKFFLALITSILIIGILVLFYFKYRQNLKLKTVENNMLNQEIEFKKQDLTNFAVNISNSLEWAESLAEQVDLIKSSAGRKKATEFENLESEIKNKVWVNKGSEDFYDKIDAFSSAFYHKLTNEFEGLTKTDIRLCSLIRLDLNTKQIAVLQNINPNSVKMSRNRLRKKLNLAPEDDLAAFLKSI